MPLDKTKGGHAFVQNDPNDTCYTWLQAKNKSLNALEGLLVAVDHRGAHALAGRVGEDDDLHGVECSHSVAARQVRHGRLF